MRAKKLLEKGKSYCCICPPCAAAGSQGRGVGRAESHGQGGLAALRCWSRALTDSDPGSKAVAYSLMERVAETPPGMKGADGKSEGMSSPGDGMVGVLQTPTLI